jgi:phage gpG-like protein
MTGVVVQATFASLDQVAARLNHLGSFNKARLLDALGQLGENQTKRRIASEKTSPSGAAWKPNRAGTSILQREGHMRDSIHHVVEGTFATRWGSGLIYAAIHQVGGTIVPKQAKMLCWTDPVSGALVFAEKVTIPARPYLGISAANAVQMQRLALSFVGGMI